MPTRWDRILDLAVSKGLLPREAANRFAASVPKEATLEEFIRVTSLPEVLVRGLDQEAQAPPPSGTPPRIDAPTALQPATYVIGSAPHPGSSVVAAVAADLLSPTTSSAGGASDLPVTIGKYAILSRLGKGGMGTVYKALDPTLRRPVALKTMDLPVSCDRELMAARFLREVQAVARLRHPGIVPVHEQGETEGTLYYTMDFIEGKSFAEALRDGTLRAPSAHGQAGPPSADAPTVPAGEGSAPRPVRCPGGLPREGALAVLVQVGQALGYAHLQGIVHRDVKPLNVLLDRDGRAFVSDFGLAKDMTASFELTQTGDVAGSPYYMSPEQSSGRMKDVTPASDVFALGVMLYEVLTGTHPFTGDSRIEILRRIQEEEAALPTRVAADIPRDLETICLKALEKDPARRYPTGKEFAEDLQRFLGGEAIEARPPSRLERVRRSLRKRPMLRGVLASLLVAGLVIASYVAYSSVREARRWRVVYEGPSRDEQVSTAWLGSPGMEGAWSIEGETLVGKPTTVPQTLIVLTRRTTEDLRVRFDVNGYDGGPDSSFGFFLASDARGWEHGIPNSPEYKCGTGYLVRFRGDRVGVVRLGDMSHPLQEGPLPALPGADGWLRVEIERAGGRIVVSVVSGGDANPRVLECVDPQPLQTKAGEEHDYSGFYWWSAPRTAVRFRGIHVSVRDVDLATNAIEGDIEAAALLFERGRYAEHRKQIERALADPALSEDARRGLRAQMDRAVFCLTWNAATPDDLLAECRLALRAGLNEDGLARLGGAIPHAARSDSWNALLDDLAGLLRTTPDSASARLLQADLLLERGRETDALRVLEDAPREVRATPSWLGARFRALLAAGKRAEAHETASDVDRAYLLAEDGACEELVGLLAKEGPNPPWQFAALLAYRMGTPPPQAMIDRFGWDPWNMVARGILAGSAKNLEAIVACWKTVPEAEYAALPAPPPRIDSPMGNPELATWRLPVERGFVRYLAGKGEESAAERFVVRNVRAERAWLRLALAIRAEADGRRDAAIGHYELCRDDCLGEEFPREWAVAAIERLGRK